MVNFWSISGNLNDNLGSANFESFSNKITFVLDRNGRSNSAITLDRSFKTSSFVYLKDSISIMCWIKVKKIFENKGVSAFIHLEDNNIKNQIRFEINSRYLTFYLFMRINSLNYRFTTNNTFGLNKWQHFALTVNKVSQRIYVNGSLVQENAFNKSWSDKIQTLFHIGGYADTYSSIELDELKIFKRSLSSEEIKNDFSLK